MGFQFGFHIGCANHPEYHNPPQNHAPCQDNIHEAHLLVYKEVALGRILSPYKHEPLPGLICSPLNLAPKQATQANFI